MTINEIYGLMANPSALTDRTLQELRQIVADFPYFHAARILYLKNLAVTEDIRFGIDLKKMAIHIPDRMKLYELIEHAAVATVQDNVKKDSKFSLIEDFLAKSGGDSSDELIYDSPLSSDYADTLLDEDDYDDETQTRYHHSNALPPELVPLSKKGDDQTEIEDDTEKKSDEPQKNFKPSDDSYFTETLAYIYIRQKRYDKALEIIRKLNLRNPEKNLYFADQIRFLEKLIKYTKNDK